MRLQVDLDIQIPRRAAVNARLAVAAGPYAHSVIDACGYLDLQGLVLARATNPIASHARIGDLFARAMAGRAGLLHTAAALLHTYRTRAVAGMSGFGMRDRMSTRLNSSH